MSSEMEDNQNKKSNKANVSVIIKALKLLSDMNMEYITYDKPVDNSGKTVSSFSHAERLLNAIALLVTEFNSMDDSDSNMDESQKEKIAIGFMRTIRRLCPEKIHKLREHVVAEDFGLDVNPNGQGVDMTDGKKKGCWEHKEASHTKTKGYAKFIWHYPTRHETESDEAYRGRILADVKKKTNGGGVIFTIISADTTFKSQYKFNAAFFQAYMAEFTKGGAKSCNINCTVCKSCKRPHRFEYWLKHQNEHFMGENIGNEKQDTKEKEKKDDDNSTIWTLLMSDADTAKMKCLLSSSSSNK